MLSPRAAASGRQAPPPTELRSGFDAAMAFSPDRARALLQTRETLAAAAQEEVAFRVISVDPANLTAGTRLHVLEPARALLAEWRQARAPFDRAVEPAMPAIHAVRDAERQIATLETEKHTRLAQAETKLEQRQSYLRVKQRHDESRARFAVLRAAHGNRDASLFIHGPIYWIAMVAIGAAEWMINYDVFRLFFGIPAIAAGVTAVMGLALAFAAHEHGGMLKQWSYRFGAERRSIERYGDWRLYGLATLAVLIVLVLAGYSRFQAVASMLADQPANNLAGADALIEVNPVRDVLFSLLANLGAWVVGVIIAYWAHDTDPQYVDATRQERRWSRRYHRFRGPTEDEKHTVEAQFEKRVRDLQTTAAAQASGVRAQHELLLQVERHETAVVAAIGAQVAANAGAYHDVLAQLVMSMQGECRIRRGEQDISAHEFKSLRPLIQAADLRAMVE